MTEPFYADAGCTLYRANALDLPLEDQSVDLVITSPPYFGLRSYTDGGEHYDGQIGDEATPTEFVDALIAATREMVRVLKPSGSIWVNLGDKYAMDDKWGGHLGAKNQASAHRTKRRTGVRSKSLIGVPWRYALRCIDDLGLILRAEVIWSKPNGLPESVTDRVRRSHETWFHFSREPRYYSAVDEIREAYDTADRPGPRRSYPPGSASSMSAKGEHQAMPGPFAGLPLNPLGKIPGSVWEVPTQPLRVPPELGVDHFAAFPMEWPRRIIRGWSPSGVCVDCGEGRRPVVGGGGYDPDALARRGTASQAYSEKTANGKPSPLLSVNLSGPEKDRYRIPHRITGYACACPEPTAPTRPAIVLDPFGGTGTTALVAKALGRHGISVDLSADYCRLAKWRVTDPGELARALEVEKPPTVMDDQLDLLDGLLT